MRRNNINRGRAILKALKRWHEDKHESVETIIIDALADIKHLCDMNGIDFFECENKSAEHYIAEVAMNDDPNFVK